MGETLTALYLQNPQLAQALRRQQFGQGLMQQGMDTSPIRSPWQGVSRLAQALLGGYENAQGDKAIKEAGEERKKTLADIMSMGMPAPAMGGEAPPPAMPATEGTAPRGQVMSAPVIPDNLRPIIEAEAAKRGIPLNVAASLFSIESGFNPNAVNRTSGAGGLGQILASTARQPGYGLAPLADADRFVPEKAIPWALDYWKARGGAIGATDFNNPEHVARTARAYGENNDAYANKLLTTAGFRPVGGGAAAPDGGLAVPVSAQGQAPQGMPQQAGAPQPLVPGTAAFHAERARRLDAAGFHQQAQIEMQSAQLAQQRELARQPQPKNPIQVVDPSDPTGKRRIWVMPENAVGQQAPDQSPMVNLTNDLRGEGAYSTDRGKTFAARATGMEDAEKATSGTLRTISRFRTALDNIETGFGSQASINLGQIANRLNVPEATLKALNLSPDQTASREQIRALSAKMVLESLGGSLGAGVSNADRDFFMSVVPGLLTSKEGNLAMLKIMEEDATRQRAVGRAWRDWRRTNGDSPDSVRRFEDEKMGELIAPEGTVKKILEDSGWKDAETPIAAPGGASGAMPTISDPAEAARLPPGTQFRTPDGRTLRVPNR